MLEKLLLFLIFFIPGFLSTDIFPTASITSAYLGSDTLFVFDTQGTVYVAGSNLNGKLGINDSNTVDVLFPKNLTTINNVTQVFSYNHTLFLKDGIVHSCGENDFGQLGLGDTKTRWSPTEIIGFENVIQVTGGVDSSHILLSNGSVYAFGRNTNNTLGLGHFISPFTPEFIDFSDAKYICYGLNHGKIMNSDKEIWTFGSGQNYQHCDDQKKNKPVPVRMTTAGESYSTINCGFGYSTYILQGNLLQTCGRNIQGSLGFGSTSTSFSKLKNTVPEFSNVTKISGGAYHALMSVDFINNNKMYSTVYSFGRATEGQLGLGGFTDQGNPTVVGTYEDLIQIISGTFSSAILTKRKMLVFGKNQNGELGLGDKENKNVPTVLFCNNGYSGNDCEFPTCYGVNSTVSTVCSGAGQCISKDTCQCDSSHAGEKCEHSICYGIGGDQSNVCSGNGVCSSLDNCTCSGDYSGNNCNFKFYGAGSNQYSILSEDGTINPSVFNKIPGVSNLKQIASSESALLLLTHDQKVYRLGFDQFGELARQSFGMFSTPTLLPLSNVTQVALGQQHSLFLTSERKIYSTGSNGFGQLGDGTMTSKRTPTLILISDVIEVSAGNGHSLALLGNGEVHSFGKNSKGELGLGNPGGTHLTPQQITTMSGQFHSMIKISAGFQFSMSLRNDSLLFCWGDNGLGQLGLGIPSSEIGQPTQMTSISNIWKIDAGKTHAILLTKNGKVYTFGSNNFGQLGNGSLLEEHRSPVSIASLSNISDISAGSETSHAMNSVGSIFSFGRNELGQLGIGTFNYSRIPVKVDGFTNVSSIHTNMYSFIIRNDTGFSSGMTDYMFAYDYFPFAQLDSAKLRTSGRSGRFSLVVKRDGTIYGLGENTVGQLGDGTNENKFTKSFVPLEGVVDVSCTYEHSLVLLKNGSVFSFGKGLDGELGIGSMPYYISTPALVTSNITRISAGKKHSLILRSDGIPFGFGTNSFGEIGDGTSGNIRNSTTQVLNATNIVEIAAGGYFSFILTNDGNAYSFGINDKGQLALGNNDNFATPTLITSVQNIIQISLSESNGLLLNSTGSAFSFGENGFGQLGLGHNTNMNSPTLISISNVQKIVAGKFGNSFLINENGILYGFGLNPALMPGLPEFLYNSPTQIKNTFKFIDVSSNQKFAVYSVAGCQDGYTGTECNIPICSGKNASDSQVCSGFGTCNSPNNCTCQEGHGGVDCELSPCPGGFSGKNCDFKYYASGLDFQSILSEDGTFTSKIPRKIQGISNVKQAVSSRLFSLILTEEKRVYGIGQDTFGALGSLEPASFSTPILLEVNDVIEVAVGSEHTLYLTSNGSLFGMGRNSEGQLGDGTSNNKNSLVFIAGNVTKIAAAERHSFYISNNQTLYVFGTNDNGQLGIGAVSSVSVPTWVTDNVIDVSTSVSHTLIIKTDKYAYSFGSNLYGQLGIGSLTSPILYPTNISIFDVSKVSAGSTISLILKNGNVYSFGDNSGEKIAQGPVTSKIKLPTLVENLTDISEISAGQDASLMVSENGTAYSFGVNTYGELGIDSMVPAAVPTVVSTIHNVSKVHSFLGSLWILKNGDVYSAGDIKNPNLGFISYYRYGHNHISFSKVPEAFSKSTRSSHSLIINYDLSLSSIGDNSFGQLGDGTEVSRNTKLMVGVSNVKQVATGILHSLVLLNTGRLYSFGRNHQGQLGDGTLDKKNVPTLITTLQNIEKIVASESFSIVLDIHGNAFGFGANFYGQLGINTGSGTSTPTIVNIQNITQIAAGGSHSLFLRSNGDVYSSGSRLFGQLGDGSNSGSQIYPSKIISGISHISAGYYHSLALGLNGIVYGFGMNSRGNIGMGYTSTVNIPTVVPQMENITKISAGYHTSFFIKSDGTMRGCGDNTKLLFGDPNLFASTYNYVTQIQKSFRFVDVSANYHSTLFSVAGCQDGYTGENCDVILCHGKNASNIDVCSGNGICNSPNNCSCNTGFYGDNCNYLECFGKNSTDSNVCSGHGSCNFPNNCTCNNEYFGDNCEVVFCSGKNSSETDVCSGNGICVAPNNCTCNIGFYGSKCGDFDCFGKNSTDSNICSGRGTCLAPNNCSCPLGFVGSQCESHLCFNQNAHDPTVCSGNGVCSSFNNCTCELGYLGNKCDEFTCYGKNLTNPMICGGQGVCVGLNNCTCSNGYSGAECSIPPSLFTCFGIDPSQGNVCSGRGNCVDVDTCVCNSGFNGNMCQNVNEFQCFGKNITDSTVCSSHGTCSSANNCTCNNNYYGTECQSYNCFEFSNTDSRVCSSKGTCIKPNECNCLSGYLGSECESPVCFGLNSSHPSVCSTTGVCSGPDRCMCKEGYSGVQCEKNDTTPYTGDINCAVFGDEYVRYYHGKKIFVLEPSICSSSGWAGFSLHTKDGIDYSMFLSVSYYGSGNELKIGEIKNHRSLEMLKTPSIGLLLPNDQNTPQFPYANKQRYTIRVDDELVKNFDYISIVCGSGTPNSNLTFPNHEKIVKRYFNVSNSRTICDTFVLSGFSNRIADSSQDLWVFEMAVYIIILLAVLYDGNRKSLYFKFIIVLKYISKPFISFVIIATFWIVSTLIDFAIILIFSPHLECSTGKSFTIYAFHLIVNLFFGIVLLAIGIGDVIVNIIGYIRDVKKRKQYKKNAWLKLLKLQTTDFYIHSDPYFFRLEQIIAFIIFALYFLFEMINLNVLIFGTENAFYFYFGKFFSTIGRSVITYLFAFYQALLPLLVTLLVLFIKWIKKIIYKDKVIDSDNLDLMLDDDKFFDLFLEFAKSEWSQENLLCYRDIRKFKRAKTKEKRTDQAFNIYYIYLNGKNSPAEVNIDGKTCIRLFKTINDESCKFESDTFENVEKTVKVNIADTWGRFCLTDVFTKYEKNAQFQEIQLENL
eukprot:gene12452-6203_t